MRHLLDCCASGYCASYEQSAAWEAEGYGDREFYGDRYLSEFDVNEFDAMAELTATDEADALYELWREATFDPDI